MIVCVSVIKLLTIDRDIAIGSIAIGHNNFISVTNRCFLRCSSRKV